MTREFIEGIESKDFLEDIAHDSIARLKSSKDGKLIEIVCVGGYSIKPMNMTREEILSACAPLPDPNQEFIEARFLPAVDTAQAEAANALYEAGGTGSPPAEDQVPVICPGCDGTGIMLHDPEKTVCGICSGDKKIPLWAANNFRSLHATVAKAAPRDPQPAAKVRQAAAE